MNHFQLHPRLQHDCLIVGNFSLSLLLMMNDSQYPWFILVPRRRDITEIYRLTENDRYALLGESCALAAGIQEIYRPDKLNIASIGNLVPQLHVHHIARYTTDPTWPDPIWGKRPPQLFEQHVAKERIRQIRKTLGEQLID